MVVVGFTRLDDLKIDLDFIVFSFTGFDHVRVGLEELCNITRLLFFFAFGF